MALQNMNPIQQILTEKAERLERYKELYSKYIEHAVNLHNYHRMFIVKGSFECGRMARQNIKAMIALEKEMIRESLAVYRAHGKIVKEQKLARKAELALKRLNPGKPGRPKGQKNGTKNTTTD